MCAINIKYILQKLASFHALKKKNPESMMYIFYVATILTISSVYSADYCAWNRAAKPISEDNAETYNWINGEREICFQNKKDI